MAVDIQIVSRHPIAPHGTTQLRCNQPAEYLRSAGFTVELGALYRTVPKARKLVILHRALLNPHARGFIESAKARGCAVVYDTDDLLFDREGGSYLQGGQKGAQYSAGWQPYADAMSLCDAVSVSTSVLRDRAMAIHDDVYHLPNALSDDYLSLAETVYNARRPRDVVNLAYLSGSQSHDADFRVIEPHLLEVLYTHPQARLILVGSLNISAEFDAFGDRVERRSFVPYAEYARVFDEIDINLIPLEVEHVFCQAKSELKFLEAGACGVVSIASPTTPHREIITDGANGYLAEGSDWAAKLSVLIKGASARKTMGDAARQLVLERYSPSARTQDWVKMVEAVLAKTEEREAMPLQHLASLPKLYASATKQKLKQRIAKRRNKSQGS